MFKKIAVVIAVLIAAVLIYAATKPDAFRVERSVDIKAPPEKVFALINDFERWQSWSPWEKLDPQMKRTFGAATAGKGAEYSWEGNSKVGKGRMEIAESTPPSKLLVNLDFLEPMKAHNFAEFTLAPQGDGTHVTWAMYGPSPYMSKLFTVFVSMDRMVGGDFERGLANLKAAAES